MSEPVKPDRDAAREAAYQAYVEFDWSIPATRNLTDALADAAVAAAEPLIRADVARRIFQVEQEVLELLKGRPTDPRLGGALSALRHARDIAEGKGP